MKIDSVLKEVLEKVEPPEKDLKLIESSVKEVLDKIKDNLKKLKIDAEVFVGGSFAKRTVIKKDKYDVDVFLRFNEKYEDLELSLLVKKILKNFKNVLLIHGSRDYFRVVISPDFFIELIPVKRVSSPKQAENITDLSYSHVRYVNRKIKSEKILEDIKIAKAFCYANNCYGAESYIKGFSGYSLELLVYYYKGFVKFLRAMSKIKEEKEVIDIEKHYHLRKDVLLDVNSSKLNSPIILIDPTYKQRNALAALSEETFRKFQKECEKFLKSPSVNSFEIKKVDLKKVKENALKNKKEFILIEIKTNKQEGDIAGSKLLKFYKHFEEEIKRYFDVSNKGFNYNHKKSARAFFVAKKKDFILYDGPFVEDKKNIVKFKKEHKNIFTKGKRVYAKEKNKFSLKDFIKKWKVKNKRKIKEMDLIGLEIV